MSWPTRAFLGETLRSLASRPFPVLTLTLILSGATLAAGVGDMLAWRDAARLAASQQASGSLVIRATTSDPAESISTAACLALDRTGGVRSAGGIGRGTLQYASTSPGLGFRSLPAAGRVVRALSGTGATGADTRPGLVLAEAVAEQLGLAAGSKVVVGGAETRVAAVAPLGRRDPQLGRVALSVGAPPGSLTACYIEFTDDHALTTLAAQLPAVFAGTAHLTLDRLFAVGAGTPTPATLWEERPMRSMFLALGAVGPLVYTLLTRARRQEYSIYLVTGSRRAHVAFMVLLGGCLTAGVGLAIAVSWLCLIAHVCDVPGYGLQLGVRSALATTVTATALMPLSVVWLARAELHRLLRERGD